MVAPSRRRRSRPRSPASAGVRARRAAPVGTARVGRDRSSRARSRSAARPRWHDAPVELVVGHAVAVTAGRARGRGAAALVLERPVPASRACASSARSSPPPRSAGCSARRVLTLAVALDREPSADRAVAHRVAARDRRSAPGMVLVPTAVAHPARPARRRPTSAVATSRRSRCWLAVAGVAVAITQVEDPLVFAGAAVLLWAALRFGPASVAWSGLVLVAAADWSAARLVGPFVDLAATPRRGHPAAGLRRDHAVRRARARLLAPGARHRRRRPAAPRPSGSGARSTTRPSPWRSPRVDGRIVETNRALCQLLATPDHALVGTELRALRTDDSGEHELPRARRERVAAGRGAGW